MLEGGQEGPRMHTLLVLLHTEVLSPASIHIWRATMWAAAKSTNPLNQQL
jgi:hypothetical protein